MKLGTTNLQSGLWYLYEDDKAVDCGNFGANAASFGDDRDGERAGGSKNSDSIKAGGSKYVGSVCVEGADNDETEGLGFSGPEKNGPGDGDGKGSVPGDGEEVVREECVDDVVGIGSGVVSDLVFKPAVANSL